jgi:MoaA/NifB/PqqE/SkfB family radical SAM enzyme
MKSLVDIVYKHSFQFAFHNNGEPFLNDEVHKGVHYADSKGLWTCIHSNFSHNKKSLIEDIIESNLKNLVISCDGATKEIYRKYRVNGDIDQVFKNISELVRKKKKNKSIFPWITAKFHVFDHNWHEIKLFKKRALDAGVNDVLFLRAFSNGIYKTGRPGTELEFSINDLKWKKIKKNEICPHMWSEEVHIDYDGGIMPCGNGYHDSHIVVPINDQRFNNIKEKLNHECFISLRKFFLKKSININELPLLCRNCEYILN